MSDPITFRTSRILPHTPATVFSAFSNRAVLASWWGPSGFNNEFEIFEFKTGGRWKFVMVAPDDSRHPNESIFAEFEPPTRLTIRHVSAPRFTLTLELAPVPGGTRLDWAQVFDDPAVAAALRHIVEPANEQNLDRLNAILAATEGAA